LRLLVAVVGELLVNRVLIMLAVVAAALIR
jgi:hypothetical protein